MGNVIEGHFGPKSVKVQSIDTDKVESEKSTTEKPETVKTIAPQKKSGIPTINEIITVLSFYSGIEEFGTQPGWDNGKKAKEILDRLGVTFVPDRA